MTKEKKIHVLADETLGGTLREYVEVNRRAEVGESVYTIISEEFRKVTRVEGVGAYLDDGGLIFHENYRVLEPTDIVLIDGNKYRLVDRKAEVGERILVKMDAEADEHNLGKVYEVIELDWEFVNTSGFYDDYSTLNLLQEEYYVLDPVVSENKPTSNAPQSTDDIVVLRH